MISVTIGNNTKRTTISVSPETSVRTILEENNLDYSRAVVTLDGSPISAGEFDDTLEDFGIKEKCYLLAVVKAENA